MMDQPLSEDPAGFKMYQDLTFEENLPEISFFSKK